MLNVIRKIQFSRLYMYCAALYTDAAEGEITVVTSEDQGMLGSSAMVPYLLIILTHGIRSCTETVVFK